MNRTPLSHGRFCRGWRHMLVATLLLATAAIFGPPSVWGQQIGLPKLTLSQLEGLIVHGVPDSTLGAQIERRGISFVPTPAILDKLHAKGAGPLTLSAIESLSSERSNGIKLPVTGVPDSEASGGSPALDFSKQFPWYIVALNRNVAQNWYKQEVDPHTPSGSQVIIAFAVARDGTVSGIHITQPSSSPTLNTSAAQALRRLRTFPPLPTAWEGSNLTVSYTFTYDRPNPTSVKPAPTQWFKPLSGDKGQYIVRISSGRYIAAGKVGFQLYVQPTSGAGSGRLYVGDSEGEDNMGSFNVWLNGVVGNYIHCAGTNYPCRMFPGMPTYINVEVDRPSGVNTLAFALKIAPGGGAWITYDFTQIPVHADFVAGVATAATNGSTTAHASEAHGSGDTIPSNQASSSLAEEQNARVPTIPYEEMAKRRIEGASPIYPPIAKATGISGTVILDAIISESGSVEKVRVISGPAMLQQSALDAVRTWQYKPYVINNEPVEVETTVHLTYSLGPRS